jgi:TetR/AcrR family transcriptional regulator, cholesterol catabolism regulator
MKEDNDALDEKFKLMLDQIREMFFMYGLKNLSMDEISRRLGISKKTLYCFVRNKEELIDRMFQYQGLKWIELWDKISEQPINAIEKLLKISLLVNEEMNNLNPMLKFELQKYYEQTFDKYMENKRKYIYQGLVHNMKQGIEEKLYRQDLNIELVASIYITGFIEMHNSDVCKMHDISFEQVFTVMFENHIRAISTTEGVAYFENRKKEIFENLNKKI